MATYQYLDQQNVLNDGAILGQTSTHKVGFWGVTPVDQPAAITHLVTTASTSTSSAFGYTTSTQAEAVTTAVNAILDALEEVGIINE